MNRRDLLHRLRRYGVSLMAPALFTSCNESPKKTTPRGASDVNDDEALAKLTPWREKHRRTAWKPIVKAGDGPITASKFSGVPWLAAGEPWPPCSGCKKPLQLFVQLNLDELPAELNQRFGDGLLQLFYCRNDDFKCPAEEGGWEPFQGANWCGSFAPPCRNRQPLNRPIRSVSPRRSSSTGSERTISRTLKSTKPWD